MTELPLFPLHAVLSPGIALPLHIFEPRYRLMVERCLDSGSPFGVVLIRSGREVGTSTPSIAGVGTTAEIRESTLLPDGRYEILAVGGSRFTITSVDADSEPYLVGRVSPLDDEIGDPARARRLADRTMRRFVRYLHLLQPGDGETAEAIEVQVEIESEVAEGAAGVGEDEVPSDDLDEAARQLIIPDDPTVLSYLLGGILQVELPARQALLEEPTTEARLEQLDRLLSRELWLLERRLRVMAPEPRLDPVRTN